MARAIDQMDTSEISVIVTKEEVEQIENESLIKLFAHACQLEQEARAMDICKLMNSTGLQLAIKYATKNRRMQLATRISA